MGHLMQIDPLHNKHSNILNQSPFIWPPLQNWDNFKVMQVSAECLETAEGSCVSLLLSAQQLPREKVFYLFQLFSSTRKRIWCWHHWLTHLLLLLFLQPDPSHYLSALFSPWALLVSSHTFLFSLSLLSAVTPMLLWSTLVWETHKQLNFSY